jgi:nanoRNase/pAp phosphatase (c-di-AMP/oligoRNAs hydrolase)
MGLSRAASPADVAAYFYLQPRIDVEALVEIERAQVPGEYFQKLNTTLHAARIYDGVVISCMGSMGHPDLAAEMADILLRLRGTQWVICVGIYRDNLILAVRTRSRRAGAERLVQTVVGDRGTAGGHGTMAGGRVPLQGGDPEQIARQLGQRALQYLQVPLEMAGVSLI